MPQSCLCLAVLLAQLVSAEAKAKACDVTGDASVLLQTNVSLKQQANASMTPARRTSMRSLFSLASSQKQSVGLSGSSAKKLPAKMIRPNIGKGPTNITFGMLPKAFYGLKEKTNRFTIDIVLTLEWTDKRFLSLIPKGAANVTLGQPEAQKYIWMPDVSVTNRAVHKLDVISTAVVLHRTGQVVKIQRVVTTVMDDFKFKEFPFDEQDLEVKVASTNYMINELVLTADTSPSFSEAPASVMDGGPFELQGWRVYSYADVDGLLKKSRGVLKMKMQRTFGVYLNTHIIPALINIALSSTVFYMPFIPQFVTPRLTVSIVCIVIFVNLQASSAAALPAGSPSTWGDTLDTNLLILMAISLVMNVYTEILFHATNVPDLASKVCNELKLIFPIMNAVVFTVILIFGSLHGGQLVPDVILKVAIAAFFICYVVFCQRRAGEALRLKKALEEDTGK